MKIAAIGATFIILSIAASALFASAASLSLTGTKLGANTTTVAACDSDGVAVSWATTYDAAIPGYKVTSVTVSGIDATACNGAVLNATLSNSSGTAIGTAGPQTITSPTASYTLAITGTAAASLVENASVSIAGP